MGLVAPAKLTVSLRITGVRDDGYHLLDAEMVSLGLADELELVEGPRQVEYVGMDAPPAHEDLVVRALELVGRHATVRVHKRIPARAGLGGGSSDAAAVLRWAGFTDPVAAVRLGADVAFCLVGGRARVSGIGEVVEPLDHRERWYTLVTPPVGCSTPEVYRRWDELGGPQGPNGNDLEPAALSVVPELSRWRDELGDATGVTPRLAGSGSTWFVEGRHPGPGRVVTHTVASASGG